MIWQMTYTHKLPKLCSATLMAHQSQGHRPICLFLTQVDEDVVSKTLQDLYTVKPVLSGHRIKRTPSIKRTVTEVPKFISLIYFK